MGTVAIFIDGGYWDKVAFYAFNKVRVDFSKFTQVMTEPDQLLRAYYYHCLPYKSDSPTNEEGKDMLPCTALSQH